MSYSIRPTSEVDLAVECTTTDPEANPASGVPKSDATVGRVQVRATLDVDLQEECGEERARALQALPESARQHQRTTIPRRLRPSDVIGWVFFLCLLGGLWGYNQHLSHTARLMLAQTRLGECANEMEGIQTILMCDLVAQGSLPEPGKAFEDVVRQTIQDPLQKRDTSKDVFGHPYHYSIIYSPDHKEIGFTLISAGPDGVFGTDDDLELSYQLPHE